MTKAQVEVITSVHVAGAGQRAEKERIVAAAIERRRRCLRGGACSGDPAIYTLIATAKLNDVDPQAWLANVLARMLDHQQKQIGELLPWNWRVRTPCRRLIHRFRNENGAGLSTRPGCRAQDAVQLGRSALVPRHEVQIDARFFVAFDARSCRAPA